MKMFEEDSKPLDRSVIQQKTPMDSTVKNNTSKKSRLNTCSAAKSFKILPLKGLTYEHAPVSVKEESDNSQCENDPIAVVEETKKLTKRVKNSNNMPLDFSKKAATRPLDFSKKNLERTPGKIVNMKIRNYRFTCGVCNTNFYRKDHLASHLVKHRASKSVECALCQKMFKSEAYLYKHLKIVHSDSGKMFSCNVCLKEFKSNATLKRHKIVKHTEGYGYSCDQCGSKFKHKEHYNTHMKNHASGPCVCDTCGRVCPTKSALAQHKNQKHTTKVKDFECEICKRRFMSEETRNHHRDLHNIQYVCEQCGKEFSSKEHLSRHLRIHSKEKPYPCKICGKSFTLLASQQVHMLTHVGERPYVCDICGKSFTQRSSMMQHRKKLHPECTEPPPPPVKISDLLQGLQDKIASISEK